MSDLMRCDCGGTLQMIKFEEKERDRFNVLTGRVRLAVSHMTCDHCLKNVTVDDSFDGPWYYPYRSGV